MCLSLRHQVYHCFSVTESPPVSPTVSLSHKPKKQERLHNQHIMHCHTDTQCPLIRCIRAAGHNRPRGAAGVAGEGLPTGPNWSHLTSHMFSLPCVSGWPTWIWPARNGLKESRQILQAIFRVREGGPYWPPLNQIWVEGGAQEGVANMLLQLDPTTTSVTKLASHTAI